MFEHEGRKYFLNEYTGAIKRGNPDGETWDTEPLPADVERAARKALIADREGFFYACGRQDAEGSHETDVAIEFGHHYAAEVFKYEIHQVGHLNNVRGIYDAWIKVSA